MPDTQFRIRGDESLSVRSRTKLNGALIFIANINTFLKWNMMRSKEWSFSDVISFYLKNGVVCAALYRRR